MLMVLARYHPSGDFVAKKQSRTSIIVLSVGIAASLTVLVIQGPNLEFWKKKVTVFSKPVEKSIDPGYQEAAEISSNSLVDDKRSLLALENDVDILNEQGVKQISKGKLWQGAYTFEKAINLNPNEIVPVLNMATTLTEMKLFKPALRYLKMAEDINSNHPLLKNKMSELQGGTVQKVVKRKGFPAADRPLSRD